MCGLAHPQRLGHALCAAAARGPGSATQLARRCARGTSQRTQRAPRSSWSCARGEQGPGEQSRWPGRRPCRRPAAGTPARTSACRSHGRFASGVFGGDGLGHDSRRARRRWCACLLQLDRRLLGHREPRDCDERQPVAPAHLRGPVAGVRSGLARRRTPTRRGVAAAGACLRRPWASSWVLAAACRSPAERATRARPGHARAAALAATGVAVR